MGASKAGVMHVRCGPGLASCAHWQAGRRRLSGCWWAHPSCSSANEPQFPCECGGDRGASERALKRRAHWSARPTRVQQCTGRRRNQGSCRVPQLPLEGGYLAGAVLLLR
jgi:hypothetical protein